MPPRGGKPVARIKKPVVSQSRDGKSRRGGRRSTNGKLSDAELNREEEDSQNDSNSVLPSQSMHVQKKPTWLDSLPPVIKLDEELHIQLLKERKEKDKIKHFDFCKNELMAMLNVALKQTDFPVKERPGFTLRAKSEFFNGIYHENADEVSIGQSVRSITPISRSRPCSKNNNNSNNNINNNNNNDNNNSDNSSNTNQTKIGIKQLLESSPTSIENAMKSLSQQSSHTEFTFDVNPEMDKLFVEIHKEMQPYVTQCKPDHLASFPFFICVVGPPCSGKSTICQFITSNFDVHLINVNSKSPETTEFHSVIDSTDDKVIINTIISEIQEIPENKGVIIRNYPETKSQLSQLEKALQSSAKKKTDARFSTINGLIRASMSMEDSQSQVKGRFIDRSTGMVFHSAFNPANSSPDSKNKPTVEPYPPSSEDFAACYAKVVPQLTALESAMKKYGPSTNIGFCKSIGQLCLKIESFLKIVYKTKNVEVPFDSFVVFETQEKFLFSKLCYNMFQIWNNDCMPMFGKHLGDLYNRLKSAKNRIEYLSEVSRDCFSLMISRPDDRKSRAEEFFKNSEQENPINFYHYIWQKSIDVRNMNYKAAEKFINQAPIKALKYVMEESEQVIFDSLLKRFLLVDWFSANLAPMLANRDTSRINDMPPVSIPQYDITNLRQLCSIMHIENYVPPKKFSKSNHLLVTPTIPNKGLSSSFAYLQTPQKLAKISKTPNEMSPQISLTEIMLKGKAPLMFASKISFGNHNSLSSSSGTNSNLHTPKNSGRKETPINKNTPNNRNINTPDARNTNSPNRRNINTPNGRNTNSPNGRNISTPNGRNVPSLIHTKSENIENGKNDKTILLELIENKENDQKGYIIEDEENNSKKEGEKEEIAKKKHSQTKEESIRAFLDYICKEIKSPQMKNEAEVMRQMFGFFLDQKSSIDQQVDEEVKVLKVSLNELIHKKCSHEMETFSTKFRLFKKGEKFEGDLFEFDNRHLTGRCLEIYNELKGDIPADRKPLNLPKEKILGLYSLYLKKANETAKRFESLENLSHSMEELGFNSYEKLLVEAQVKMTTLPDFIEIIPFIISIAPNEPKFFEIESTPITPKTVIIPLDPTSPKAQPQQQPCEIAQSQ